MVRLKINLRTWFNIARVSGLGSSVVRNLLIQFAGAFQSLYGQLDGFIHPSVTDDPWQRPRHKAFLAGCFVSGAAALVVLPLHLALMGPTSLPMTLLLAFLLGQWPLALYLTQSGNLERAYGFSSALFAAFLAGMCALTGGLASFALVWFAAVPMEAALSGARRIIVAVCGLCAVLLALLAVLPALPVAYGGKSSTVMLLSSLAACIYMTVLALRLAVEQRRARQLMGAGERRWHQLNASTEELACRCTADGSVKLLGGPLEPLLGFSARQARGDWFFQRLHVADRPAYLSALADARTADAPIRLDVRLRKGSTLPGEAGIAEYVWLTAQFKQPATANGASQNGFDDSDVILTLADRDQAAQASARSTGSEAAVATTARPQVPQQTAANADLEKPLADIVSYADLLCQSPAEASNWAQQREYAELIHRSGLEVLQAVQNRTEASRLQQGERGLTIEPVDLEGVLESCRAMLTAVAANGKVTLDLTGDFDFPRIPADRRALRQIALDLLSHAISSAKPGGSVLVTGRRQDKGVLLEVLVTPKDAAILRGPQNLIGTGPKAHNGQALRSDAGDSLGLAAGLVELHKGTLNCQTLADGGRMISVWLPAGAHKGAAATAADPLGSRDRSVAGGSWS